MKIDKAMKILDLTVPFCSENAKANYRRRAMLQHPDKGGDGKGMAELNEAYELCCKGMEMPVGPKINDHGVEFNFEFFKKKPNVKKACRVVLKWFNGYMLGKLEAKSYKGLSWRNESSEDLYKAMIKECGELWDEINRKDRDKEKIIKECADVANFTMMIADNAKRKL